jgi:hypothetical protein
MAMVKVVHKVLFPGTIVVCSCPFSKLSNFGLLSLRVYVGLSGGEAGTLSLAVE